MSNEENKTVEKVEEKKSEVARGSRGDLGPGTAGSKIRQLWRENYFLRENAQDKHNPNKRVYVQRPGTPTLKQFALNLLDDGDELAKEWFANKKGAKNQKRSDANVKAAREASSATMAGRRAAAAKNQKK